MYPEDVELLRVPFGERDVEVSLVDLQRPTDDESAAARFLTAREREEYGTLRHPGRRREWLGARLCLKAMLVRRQCVSDPVDCQIRKDARGRPRLEFAPGFPRRAVHDCSLSHKGRFACACATSAAGMRVGVDIERIAPRLVNLAPAFVHPLDAVDQAGSAELRLAVLWSLKEAYAKALGLGLGVGLGNVVVRQTGDGRHRVGVRDGPTLFGRHLAYEGYVVAICSTPGRDN